MESDADPDRLVVLGEDLTAQKPRHESRDSLLTIDQDAFSSGRRAVLELHRRIAPRDEVAHGVTLIKRVEEVTDFGRLPYKGSLNLWDGDLTRLYPSKKRFNGVRRN